MRVVNFILIFILFSLIACNAKRNYDVNVTSFACDVLIPEQVKEIHCELDKKGNYDKLSVKFVMARQINHFDMQLQFDIFRKDNKKMSLFDMRADGCKYLESFYKSGFMLMAYQRIMKNGNLPKKCPILANTPYVVENFPVIPDDYPAVVPQMVWRAKIKLYSEQKHYGTITTRGAVIHKN